MSEKVIARGRVTVGGEVVTDPARDVGEGDDVRVDGSPVGTEPREVWAVNKPTGVISTAREPGERPAVVELVRSAARLYPVGRLDADSTGLLLLTNDGELANRLTHPRYEVEKVYLAELASPPSEVELGRLAAGVELEDGPTAPAGCAAAVIAKSRSSCAKGETASCGGWSRRWATRCSPCGGFASPRSSWGGWAPVRPVASAGGGRLPLEGCRGMKIGADQGPQERLFAVRGAVQAEANEAAAIIRRPRS